MPQIFWDLIMTTSSGCLFLPCLWESCSCIWNSSEILFGHLESAHIICQAAKGAPESWNLFLTYSTILAQKFQNKRSLKSSLSVLPFFSEVHSVKITYKAELCPSPLSLVILPLAVTELSDNNQLPATLPCCPDSQLWIRALTFTFRA